MLNVVMQNVVIPKVVEPKKRLAKHDHILDFLIFIKTLFILLLVRYIPYLRVRPEPTLTVRHDK